ncbi:MAG: hypothetical protein EBE86_002345 [Hormoscilla sp. GUM202]|nr:hypothetical protein [Hormoscilla sp. GUM202]
MFYIVIALNLLISLLCLFVAFRVWRLRQTLSRVADALISAELETHAILHPAPHSIIKGQRGTSALRRQYRSLMNQVKQVQQILAIVSLVLGVGHRGCRRAPPFQKNRTNYRLPAVGKQHWR